MNTIQPHLKRRNGCVVMVIHILAQPDWINIPCFQKIPPFVVCQKMINQREGKNVYTRNGSLDMEVEMCQNDALLIKNRCISFTKYNNPMNLSELKYDTNDIESTEIINLGNKTLFQYFTIIQHFYKMPLQFTISFTRTYLYYKPYQTNYFLKLAWKSILSNNRITEYYGYLLSANNPMKQTIPSNVFKCDDGSYINEILICDGKMDCIQVTDEKQCSCNHAMDLLPVGCKYFCNEISHQCFCSSFLLYLFIFLYLYPLFEGL